MAHFVSQEIIGSHEQTFPLLFLSPLVTTKREVSIIGLTSEREREKLREDVEQIETRFDVNERAGSNQCPTFGTDLLDKDKDALVEYLKTL